MHIPEVDGMKTFTGEIIHTRYFQDSTYYVGKTIVLVGAGFSGLDIFTEIHTVAKKVSCILLYTISYSKSLL